MARVLIHCPLNISRSLVQLLEEFCQQLQQAHDLKIEIVTQPHRAGEKSLFKSYLEDDVLPELTIGHVDDFADLPGDFRKQQLRALPDRFPLRKELAELGFKDADNFFHPFVVVPFAIFYNHNLLQPQELPQSWQDLLAPRWQRKIIMPDNFRIVSTLVRAFLKTDFLADFEHFAANFVQQGSPLEVVNAVDDGQYPLGIANIAFARISKQKNTRLIWPEDGLFCMPQVMVWSKQAPEPLLEIGDFLLSEPVQSFLNMQSFVGASPELPLHPLIAEHHCQLQWKGWPEFLQVVKGRLE